MGTISQDKVIDTFQNVPWTDYLKKMETTDQKEIYFSPSLEVENEENKNGLSISAVGTHDNFEFYIFYKRPKLVKQFFGIIKKMDDSHVTDITGQSNNDALECLQALLKNDLDFLDNKIK